MPELLTLEGTIILVRSAVDTVHAGLGAGTLLTDSYTLFYDVLKTLLRPGALGKLVNTI